MCLPTDQGGQHQVIRADYNGRIAEYQVMTQLVIIENYDIGVHYTPLH
jgi:hypothetical protein